MSAVHNSGAPHRLLCSPARCRKGKRKSSRVSQTQNPLCGPRICTAFSSRILAPASIRIRIRKGKKSRRRSTQIRKPQIRIALRDFCTVESEDYITFQYIPIYFRTLHFISLDCIGRWFWRIGCFPRKWEWDWILDLGGRVEAIEEAACRGWLGRPPSPWQPPLHAACKLCHSSLLEVRIAMPQ